VAEWWSDGEVEWCGARVLVFVFVFVLVLVLVLVLIPSRLSRSRLKDR
jgi:hypothetical protein